MTAALILAVVWIGLATVALSLFVAAKRADERAERMGGGG